jgi:alpha-galactosidase
VVGTGIYLAIPFDVFPTRIPRHRGEARLSGSPDSMCRGTEGVEKNMTTTSPKIVAVGAGSGFGRGTIVNILGAPEFEQLGGSLVLMDTDSRALERMHRFALLVKEHFRSRVTIEAATRLREALPGANYVIISVAVKRYELWEQDFRVPLAFGFKHALGENGGPGALFHALRNFELVIPICREVEELCPDALVLNYTNPESRIVRAISDLTKVRAVGLCHGVFGAQEGVSRILGVPSKDLDFLSGGLNHFFWFLKIADRRTGKDLYPELRRRALSDSDCPAMPPLVRKMLEVFGHYTYPSDDHIGEYLSFAYEFTGLKWHYGLESHKVPPAAPSQPRGRTGRYVAGEGPLDEDALEPSGELAVPIILAIELNRRLWADAVNVPNAAGYLDQLPQDAVVELPAWADGGGIHPQKLPPMPEALAAFCRTQASIQQLVVEGYRQRSRNLLLQTLLLDPVVNSVANAETMLDYMLELQSEYLPKFA